MPRTLLHATGSALAAAVVLSLLAAGRALPAPSDANVHGVRGGAQHSPSVAMTPVGGTYVLTYDRVDTTTAVDFVRLAMSPDESQSFHDVTLPVLPANWTWRPNAAIAFDAGTGRMWMVGQARSHLGASSRIGLFVAAGPIGPGGSINWSPPASARSSRGGSRTTTACSRTSTRMARAARGRGQTGSISTRSSSRRTGSRT